MSAELLEELWIEAVADAGLQPDAVKLYKLDSQVLDTGEQAISFARGTLIDHPAHLQSLGSLQRRANDEDRSRTRIIVCTQHHPIVVVALGRHELEHAAQFDAYDRSHRWFDSSLTIVGELAEQFGNGGILYNRIPMEVDANCSASRFVRSHFGDRVVEHLIKHERGYDRLFRTCVAPPDKTDLRMRMKEFNLRGAKELAINLAESTKSDS